MKTAKGAWDQHHQKCQFPCGLQRRISAKQNRVLVAWAMRNVSIPSLILQICLVWKMLSHDSNSICLWYHQNESVKFGYAIVVNWVFQAPKLSISTDLGPVSDCGYSLTSRYFIYHSELTDRWIWPGWPASDLHFACFKLAFHSHRHKPINTGP